MRDEYLYAQIVGIHNPCQVTDVELTVSAGEVRVFVEHEPRAELRWHT